MENSSVKILIVDDESDVCHSIASYFEIFGYETHTCYSGTEALELVNREKFHLVITDLRMPSVSGIEVLKAIKTKDRHYPKVYAISGYTDFSLEEIYSQGADGFLAKPFDSRGMLEAIRKATLPLGEIWKRRPSVEPNHEVMVQGHLSNNQIVLGRGGFAVGHDPSPWEVGDLIRLQIQIMEPSIPNLRGAGTVRWKRNHPRIEGQEMSGIEIVYLEDTCRDHFAKWLSQSDELSFIPSS